jgi:hypothetical protein
MGASFFLVQGQEIREALDQHSKGLKPQDRPDIVNRVFHLKLQQLLKRLTTSQYFGRRIGIFWVVEFQKRGLETPVFAHGQLYVACSRTGDYNTTLIALPLDEKTNQYKVRNVVYRSVL